MRVAQGDPAATLGREALRGDQRTDAAGIDELQRGQVDDDVGAVLCHRPEAGGEVAHVGDVDLTAEPYHALGLAVAIDLDLQQGPHRTHSSSA